MYTMSSVTSEETKELTVPLKKPDHLAAVPDHRVNYKRRPPPAMPTKKNCCKRFLIFLTFIFCLSTLTLVGVLVWREFSHQECLAGPIPVNEMFPGYFRTAEQQKVFEDMVLKKGTYILVNHSVTMGYECETKCSAYNAVNATTTNIQVQTPDLCCESNVRYVPLKTLTNIEGEERVISQANDTFQYFAVETCSHNSGCKGCKCVQSQRLFTAVYEYQVEALLGGLEVKHMLDWFSLPENCHCKIQT